MPQAKKLLWRINKAIAKDLLPTEPQLLRLEPWWVAHVVNLGEGRPFLLPACSSAITWAHAGSFGSCPEASAAARSASMVLWSIALLELVFASSTCGPAGEVEFQQLTPAELRICRSIVGANGQRVSALDPKCVNSSYLLTAVAEHSISVTG